MPTVGGISEISVVNSTAVVPDVGYTVCNSIVLTVDGSFFVASDGSSVWIPVTIVISVISCISVGVRGVEPKVENPCCSVVTSVSLSVEVVRSLASTGASVSVNRVIISVIPSIGISVGRSVDFTVVISVGIPVGSSVVISV